MALTNGRIIRTKETNASGVEMEDFPLQTANPDSAPVSLPAQGVISGMVISDPPTQAEVQALRDECENLRDALAVVVTDFNTFKNRLTASGDIPLFED